MVIININSVLLRKTPIFRVDKSREGCINSSKTVELLLKFVVLITFGKHINLSETCQSFFDVTRQFI